VLGILDADSGEILHRCEYERPPALRASGQKMQFTGFCLDGDQIYACSHTEIVHFVDWPPVEPKDRLSLVGFNDLHHCILWKGGLAVANTGLETVDHVSLDGDLLQRWDLLNRVPDARHIDPAVDYRQFADTKPHRLHLNHLFVRDGELWVTQLNTSRAVCVTADHAEITIDAGMPHDGRYVKSSTALAFTTVNGFVVLVDPESLEVTASHDLKRMTPGATVLGWCRGVCDDPRDADRFFVAFSFLRSTPWREYGFWIKHGHKRVPSRIDLFDVKRGEVVESIPMTQRESLVLFQLEVLPRSLWI
jgi:hypothetical protein